MDNSDEKSGRPSWNDGHADVQIHPSSALKALSASQFTRPYLVYLEKVSSGNAPLYANLASRVSFKALFWQDIMNSCSLLQMRTSRAFLVDCTVVSPALLCLTSGHQNPNYSEAYVMLDEWIRVKGSVIDLLIMSGLRQAVQLSIESIISSDPRQSETQSELFKTVCKLLNSDESSLVLR